MTISEKMWFFMSVYRPTFSSNIDTLTVFWRVNNFFTGKAVNKFENLIVMGDFDIDITK